MASGARKRAAPDPYRNEAWERNKGKVNEKLERARPYGFFLSTIESDPTTHGERLSVSFPGTYLFFRQPCPRLAVETVLKRTYSVAEETVTGSQLVIDFIFLPET